MNKVLEEVVDGLKKQPVLLLVFGLCFIGFLLTIKEADPLLRYMMVAGLFVLASLVVVRFTQAAESRPPPVLPSEDRGLLPVLSSIADNFREAQIVIPTQFFKEIEFELDGFLQKSKEWREGELSPPTERYDNVLMEAYRSAEHSIFSTTIKDYLDTWESPLGEELLRIHAAGKASVVRVFIVDKESDINSRLIQTIRKHMDTPRVEVRVLLVSKYPNLPFPMELSRDFTLIDDGKALGITRSYGLSNLTARWHFQRDPMNVRIRQILEFKDSLIKKSTTAKQFIEQYGAVPS